MHVGIGRDGCHSALEVTDIGQEREGDATGVCSASGEAVLERGDGQRAHVVADRHIVAARKRVDIAIGVSVR